MPGFKLPSKVRNSIDAGRWRMANMGWNADMRQSPRS